MKPTVARAAKRRTPTEFTVKIGDDNREMAWVTYYGLDPGIEISTTCDGLNAKDARRLSKWLLKAADFLESL